MSGFDRSEIHLSKAIERGIIQHVLSPEDLAKKCDVIVISIPVDATAKVLAQVLDKVTPGVVVIDLGSTKENICKAVEQHPNRAQYVAAHPIAGTENSGPEAAFDSLFSGYSIHIYRSMISFVQCRS